MRTTLILLAVLATTTFGQHPPCMPESPFSYYSTPIIKKFPAYSTDMPYDVLLAYAAVDSMAYYENENKLMEFIGRQDYGDTLRTIMKYYYTVVDYDPVLFFASKNYINTGFTSYLSHTSDALDEQIIKVSPNSYYDYELCRADIIAHVRITDTATSYNSEIDDTGRNEIVNVRFEILDTIKGKVIPALQKQSNDTTGLVFSYCKYWSRNTGGNNFEPLLDNAGQPWIKKGKEYVVFLKLISLCVEDGKIYYCVRPVWPESRVFLMFPVDENGLVYNPAAEFGIPDQTPVSVFKQELRKKIDVITTF